MSVQEYVAMQPKLTWRRRLMRAWMRATFRLFATITVTGMENLPASGGTIIMMNHISLLDPILCMATIKPRFVVPMTKVENMRNPLLAPFIRFWGSYSVNRGEVDRTALTNSVEMIKSGAMILIAPEGTRQREGLSRPKDGMAYVATKADAIIVPAAISGARDWMRNLTHFKRSHIHIHYGRAFKFKTDGRARIPRDELAAMTEEAMYQLAAAVSDTSMRGLYSDLSQSTTDHLTFL
ncbi:MAG: 1-acyl-sn-glycerol-3-phosphate acyltransferase [Anaerolinea sp.]|nr:1-acyl-sn-glycerol-3-phosphate acyltransferase [Anaerolinea sp.]